MKPQIKSQIAHDPKEEPPVLPRRREAPSGTLILPISRPGVEPLIFQLTDDKSWGIARVSFCLIEDEGVQTL